MAESRQTVSFTLDSEELALLDAAVEELGGKTSRGHVARFLVLQALRSGPPRVEDPGGGGREELARLASEVGTLSRQMLELGQQLDQVVTISRGNATSAGTINDGVLSVGQELVAVHQVVDEMNESLTTMIGALTVVLQEG